MLMLLLRILRMLVESKTLTLDETYVHEESLSPCGIIKGDRPRTPIDALHISIEDMSNAPVSLLTCLLHNYCEKICWQIVFNYEIYQFVADCI